MHVSQQMKTVSKRAAMAIAAAALLLACGEQSPEEMFAEAEKAAAAPATRQRAAEQFQTVLERFPEDEVAPRALKQLAMLAQQDGQMETAISRYEQLLRDYPASDQGDEAQFMIAFIYEDYLGDLDRARVAYQHVIDRYPDSDLAVSARRLLPNVGLDPEEWVEFQDAVGNQE
jgi:TolA-binding protein